MNQNKLNNDEVVIEILNNLTKRDNLNTDDVLGKVSEIMKRNTILKQHKENYKVWQANDGRWKTKLPDGNKYGKLIAKATLENLENFIVDYYKALGEEKENLEAVYPKFIECKYLSSEKGTANKLQWVWNTYYKDSTIIKVELSKMTVGDLSEWLLELIAKRDLTKKKYVEFKGLMNQLYDYCISHNMVQINLPRQIAMPSKNAFFEPKAKPEEEIIYSSDTKSEVIKEALAQFEKTKNTAYLAICLNFNLGLRVGELVALRESDIDGDIIHIRCSEVKDYAKDENGKIVCNGYKVADTKTKAGIRNLILTPDAKKYIKKHLMKTKPMDEVIKIISL